MSRSPNTPCSSCGKLLWPPKAGQAIAPTCNSCRVSARRCGTLVKYDKSKCRCVDCRAAKARASRDFNQRFRADNGYAYWAKYKTPENSGTWIGKRRRYEIYERDGFVCGICCEPVDMELHWNDDYAASLDHIKPRSRGGDDTNENLRMAHRVCNSLRQAPEFA